AASEVENRIAGGRRRDAHRFVKNRMERLRFDECVVAAVEIFIISGVVQRSVDGRRKFRFRLAHKPARPWADAAPAIAAARPCGLRILNPTDTDDFELSWITLSLRRSTA